MADPITTEDLYGTSKEGEKISIPIEETPEIVPIVETPQPETPPTPPPSGGLTPPIASSQPPSQPTPQLRPKQSESPKKGSGCLRSIGVAVIFIALFIGGIWLSSVIRGFLPSDVGGTSSTTQPVPQETPSSTESAMTISNVSNATWKTYEAISGVTKGPFSGVNFKLPDDVLAPICDNVNCASQGTFLPGGTRFTVAARGAGQLLPDFRGSNISDVGGVSFTTSQMTVAGHTAIEYTGVFTGNTNSGYAFTRMRGVMIAVSDSTSIEINHFAPAGITADFEADDTLFNSILQAITFTGSASVPSLTGTPTPTTTTSSGH